MNNEHPKPIHSHVRHLALIAMLCIFLLGCLILGYFRFFDGTLINKVIEFNAPKDETGTYLLDTERMTYHRGEMVYVMMDFCKYRDITPAGQWALVDTYVTLFPETHLSIVKLGCTKKLIAAALIPVDAIYADDYYLQGSLTYTVNGLRDLVFKFKTNRFHVIK